MKLTASQSWLAHSLEGLGVMAAVTTVALVLPQIQSGSFTWQQLGVAVIAAGVTVGSKYGAGVLTNTQTIQALSDTVSQTIQAQPQPTPVIIHNNMPPAPTVAPVASQGVNLAPPTQPQFIQPVINSTTAVQPAPSSGFTSLEMPAVTQ